MYHPGLRLGLFLRNIQGAIYNLHILYVVFSPPRFYRVLWGRLNSSLQNNKIILRKHLSFVRYMLKCKYNIQVIVFTF